MNGEQSDGRVCFLGLEFDSFDQTAAVQAILELSRSDGFHYVVTPNVDHVVRLHSGVADKALWQSYRNASLCLCDSRILRGLARQSGLSLPLVTGSDLTASLAERAARDALSVTVVGGDSELMQRLVKAYPAIDWSHCIPPMGLRHDGSAQKAVVEFVEGQRANLTLFAVGSPQSELLCGEIAERQFARGVGLCIGASLEFLTGTKKRAPRWMQKAALEWLYRLGSEPRRLGKRYLIEGPAIFRIWRKWHHAASGGPAGSGSSSKSPN